MKSIFQLFVLFSTLLVAQVASAEVACDIGLYSKYVGGVDIVLDENPVVQGSCTKSFSNGVYVNGWFSQSTKDPGLKKTYGNEIDIYLGWGGKISESLSGDVHVAYYDLANEKLLSDSNGDMTNPGGTLRYHMSGKTSFYSNVETYQGIGSKGFQNGWKSGLGIRTNLADKVSIDASVYHYRHLGGNGKILKLGIEPVQAVAKFAGGEVRPTVTLLQPLTNKTASARTFHAVLGVRMNW